MTSQLSRVAEQLQLNVITAHCTHVHRLYTMTSQLLRGAEQLQLNVLAGHSDHPGDILQPLGGRGQAAPGLEEAGRQQVQLLFGEPTTNAAADTVTKGQARVSLQLSLSA